MGEEVNLNLRRVAMGYGLSVLLAASADQALQAILCLRPRLIIVQVSRLTGDEMKLIRSIADLAWPVPLVAVATSHDEEIERAVRHMGVTWYLPYAGSQLLDCVLMAILPPGSSVRNRREDANE